MTREEAKQIIITEYCKNRAFCELYLEDCKEDECEIYHALKALEAEPKQGRWIIEGKLPYRAWILQVKCSECDYRTITDGIKHRYNFCPNCGVKMDEVRNG